MIGQVVFDYPQDKFRAVFFMLDSQRASFFKLFFICFFIQAEYTLARPVKLLRRAVLSKKMLSKIGVVLHSTVGDVSYNTLDCVPDNADV